MKSNCFWYRSEHQIFLCFFYYYLATIHHSCFENGCISDLNYQMHLTNITIRYIPNQMLKIIEKHFLNNSSNISCQKHGIQCQDLWFRILYAEISIHKLFNPTLRASSQNWPWRVLFCNYYVFGIIFLNVRCKTRR